MHIAEQSKMYDSTYFINLLPNEYSQEVHCYPFAVKLDRRVGSFNILHDLSNKVFVPNETKTLTKHISCE